MGNIVCVMWGFKFWVGLIVYLVVLFRDSLIVIIRILIIIGFNFVVNWFFVKVNKLKIRMNVLIILLIKF